MPDGPAADAAEAVTVSWSPCWAACASGSPHSRPASSEPSRRTPTHRCSPACPASGTVRAATLLAEIGDARARFPTDDALAAAAGVCTLHPSLRALPHRRVPPRLQQPAPPSRRRLRRRQPTRQPLGPGHLRPSSRPRPATPTPSGSWPAPGSASSGAAGPNTPPTTRPVTTPSPPSSRPTTRSTPTPPRPRRWPADQGRRRSR